ncbi:MAG: hypothetical protein M5U26_09805 [Planctomycetota bacterium]|nr:hypothetical protein [Planctomycetota bacterium]
MKRTKPTCGAILLALLAAAPLGAADSAPDGAGIKALVKEVGSEDFDVRDAATRKLCALAERAVPALLEALREKPDAELRARFGKVVELYGALGKEVNGLKAELALDRASVAAGQPFQVSLTLRNAAESDLNVYVGFQPDALRRVHWDPKQGLLVRGADLLASRHYNPDGSVLPAPPIPAFVLVPKGSFVKLPMNGTLYLKGSAQATQAMLERTFGDFAFYLEAPGKLRIRARLSLDPKTAQSWKPFYRAPEQPAWTGELHSQEVEIELTDKLAKPGNPPAARAAPDEADTPRE